MTVEEISRPAKSSFKRKVALGAATLLAAASAPIILPSAAQAHGWVVTPPSRQAHCAAGNVSWDCQGIQYEPQSVEAPKGSLECNGGGASWTVLNDDTLPWPRTQVGSTVTIQWNLTAAHNTSTWEYFVDGELHQVFEENGRPPSNVSHTLTNLPAGDHTILARWNVADTVMAFYNCIDVRVGSGGDNPTPTPTPTPDPTTTPDPTPTPTPDPTDGPDADAWDAGAVYVKDDEVVHGGIVWRAQWWTQGEEPGTTGPWGVWRSVGQAPGGGGDHGGDDGDHGHHPEPTEESTQEPTEEPTQPAGDAWSASAVYLGGATVTHNGQTYQASWWTQGDEPGTTGEWGAWRLVG